MNGPKLDVVLTYDDEGITISERGSKELMLVICMKKGKLHIIGPINKHMGEWVLTPEGLKKS